MPQRHTPRLRQPPRPGYDAAYALRDLDPQFYADGEFDPVEFRNYFLGVQQLGFESAWTQENVLERSTAAQPLEVMTYAAACTQQIRLGCVVFVSTLHVPVHLAKSLASLDQLSGGRLDIGVGTGGKHRPFAAFGMSPERYVRGSLKACRS